MKVCFLIILTTFGISSIVWSQADAHTSNGIARNATRIAAYFQPIRMIPTAKHKTIPKAIEVTGCMQYRAPEVNLILCKLTVYGANSVVNFEGHVDFKDKLGKIHTDYYNISSNRPYITDTAFTKTTDLVAVSAGEVEIVSFRWVLDGYTDASGKTYGQQPWQGDSVIDMVCKREGYQKE